NRACQVDPPSVETQAPAWPRSLMSLATATRLRGLVGLTAMPISLWGPLSRLTFTVGLRLVTLGSARSSSDSRKGGKVRAAGDGAESRAAKGRRRDRNTTASLVQKEETCSVHRFPEGRILTEPMPVRHPSGASQLAEVSAKRKAMGGACALTAS